MTSCHCHVFVAPRKLRILSIATDGSRFFEQLNLIFAFLFLAWMGRWVGRLLVGGLRRRQELSAGGKGYSAQKSG